MSAERLPKLALNAAVSGCPSKVSASCWMIGKPMVNTPS